VSGFDATLYALGLLAFWLGFGALVVALCVTASRADERAGCACECEEDDPC